MSRTFLSYGKGSETAELSGANQRPRQIGALSRMGINFFVAADGWPRVPRTEIERHQSKKTQEPDFSTLTRINTGCVKPTFIGPLVKLGFSRLLLPG